MLQKVLQSVKGCKDVKGVKVFKSVLCKLLKKRNNEMPELKHVKAVRTRYLNTLSKEIENGCVLLQLDLQVVDLSETKERIEMSLKRIKT